VLRPADVNTRGHAPPPAGPLSRLSPTRVQEARWARSVLGPLEMKHTGAEDFVFERVGSATSAGAPTWSTGGNCVACF
jgi:hypothetical protein